MENNVGVASRRHADIVPFNNKIKKKNSKHFICNFCKYMYVVYMSFNSYCSISVKNMFHVKENTQFQLYNE